MYQARKKLILPGGVGEDFTEDVTFMQLWRKRVGVHQKKQWRESMPGGAPADAKHTGSCLLNPTGSADFPTIDLWPDWEAPLRFGQTARLPLYTCWAIHWQLHIQVSVSACPNWLTFQSPVHPAASWGSLGWEDLVCRNSGTNTRSQTKAPSIWGRTSFHFLLKERHLWQLGREWTWWWVEAREAVRGPEESWGYSGSNKEPGGGRSDGEKWGNLRWLSELELTRRITHHFHFSIIPKFFLEERYFESMVSSICKPPVIQHQCFHRSFKMPLELLQRAWGWFRYWRPINQSISKYDD